MDYVPPKKVVFEERKVPFNTSLRDALGEALAQHKKIDDLKLKFKNGGAPPPVYGVGKHGVY